VTSNKMQQNLSFTIEYSAVSIVDLLRQLDLLGLSTLSTEGEADLLDSYMMFSASSKIFTYYAPGVCVTVYAGRVKYTP